MRHTADGGFKTPDACGETLSEMNIAPVAFNLNQSSVVCLPLVTDVKRLIWIQSDQINLKLDAAAELDKAFDRFPYLTQTQTAALAQRCSLHPDQVRVWFMVQRLRYGISWDYKDIPKVRSRLSRGKEEQQKNGGEADKRKREVEESGGKKAGEVREEQTANEVRMNQEQPVKGEKYRKVEKDTRSTQKKERAMVTDKKRKRGRVEVETKSDEGERESPKSKPTQSEWAPREKEKAKASKRLPSIQEWPAHKSIVLPDEALDAPSPPIPLSQTQASDVPPLTDNQNQDDRMTPMSSSFEGKTDVEAELEEELHGESTNPTDVCKLGVNNNLVVLDSPTQLCCSTKMQTQRAMMKKAFAICQYPDSESYNYLAELIDIPRYKLVQWYGDMRYYIKERKPGWLTKEQHSQALANVRYRQYLSSLAKAQPCGGGGNVTLKMKLERSENCGVDESVQVAPEQK